MSYYNICPHCEAHLDPSEVCDCMKNAAPVLQHKDGAEQIDKPVSWPIVPHEDVTLQEFYDAVNRLDEAGKIMIEAIMHCKVDFRQLYHFSEEVYREAIKRLEAMDNAIYTDAANYIKTNLLGGIAV